MDQPTPDQQTPEPAPELSASEASRRSPDAGPSPAPVPARTREGRVENRLQRLVGDDETIVAWARGWVSRERRLHRLLAARTFDFAVLTEHTLCLCSTGFFTRRPRRRVYLSRLDRTNVSARAVPRGRRLRITSRNADPLWLELRVSDRATTFADALVACARAD